MAARLERLGPKEFANRLLELDSGSPPRRLADRLKSFAEVIFDNSTDFYLEPLSSLREGNSCPKSKDLASLTSLPVQVAGVVQQR